MWPWILVCPGIGGLTLKYEAQLRAARVIQVRMKVVVGVGAAKREEIQEIQNIG